MADFRKIGKGITGALTKASEIAKSKRVTGDQAAADAIGKAAESAGMNKPVTANKDLTTMQDFHTSFGDSVRKRAMDMQATMDSLDYKYDKGHRVFTEDSARKNWPPMTVLGRVLEGNRIMREDPTDFLSKKIIDPETGKAVRTPYEAGYKVRLEHAPDNWSEFVIPESAIKGSVSEARGGIVHMVDGGRMAKGVMGALTKAQEIAKARRAADMMPTARIGLPAPNILIPSKLNNVREAVRNMKGNYGARRVERAADEIPNLERMYQEDALKEAFTGDNARGVMTMNPADFEKYSAPLDPRFMDKNSTRYTTSGERLAYPDYMKDYLPNVGPFSDVPYLNLFKDEVGLPTKASIIGHEGRHRNRVLADKGETSALVQVNPRGDLREGMPRRTQEEFIEALKEELDSANRLVLPEKYFDNFDQKNIKRPAIDLPDIYAEGGGVKHMAKAGRVGDVVEGGLSLINKAKEIAKARKAAAEGSKIEEVLASKTAPMTTPQGTGLPLMPRDNGMYTLRDQKDLPRMVMVDKARAAGVSPKYNERTQDLLDSPKARKKVDNLINKGKELNVQEWYGTEPLRQVALDAGRTPEQFESLMAQLASASQRNPVDKQNQMGSYLYHLSETGQLPENSLLLTNKLKKALKEDPSLAEGRQLVELPTGYGSLAQGDIFNRAVMIGQGKIGEALPPNKKLGTFYENLLGNLKPVTVDVNALRGPIIEQGDPRWLTSKLVEKDDKGKIINSYKPREMYNSGEMSMREAQQRPGFWEAAPSGSEYAGFEDLWQRGAKRHNVEPAEAQALGWYGSADVTALKTKPENYVDNLERLIKRTAEQTGQSPTKVMNDLVTGEGFLRKDGGKVEEPHWHKVFNRKMAEGGYAWVDDKHIPKVRSLKHLAKGGSSDDPPFSEYIKDVPQVIKEATQEEAESYKKPRSISDVLYRGLVANNPVSAGVDMVNAGLMGVDALTGLMGKPTRLSSEKPFAGSEHVKDLMKKYGVTTEEERPISEALLGITSPTAILKGAREMPKLLGKAGDAIKGGLNALPKNLPVGMSIEMVGDLTPKEQALAKMREMRPEMKSSSDLQKKYDAEMDSKYTRDMPTFEQWKAKQNAKKAHGGLTLMR